MNSDENANYHHTQGNHLVESSTSRNYAIEDKRDFNNSKSFSQSDKKLPSHQRLVSDTSMYSQDGNNPEYYMTRSDKKSKLKIKLINHSRLPSSTNENLRMSKIYETARENGSQKFNNFMKLKEGHKRVYSKNDFPKIPPINKVYNQLDYESSEADVHQPQKSGNQILVSSHYSMQPRNRSFDLRKEHRIHTGIQSSNNEINKFYSRYHRSTEMTTEPEAVLKIIKKNKKKKGKKGQIFKIRSNSHHNSVMVNKFKKQTRNIYNGLWNSLKRKKMPWKPSGIRDALFHHH